MWTHAYGRERGEGEVERKREREGEETFFLCGGAT
jgi:hypothetical protein